jgi:hypothetical protein
MYLGSGRKMHIKRLLWERATWKTLGGDIIEMGRRKIGIKNVYIYDYV